LIDCIKLPADFVSELEKYVQGTKAAYEKIEYGIPSLGIWARFPKMKEKIIIEKTGLIIAQENPSIVCLYITFISLDNMKYSRSLCLYNSLKSTKLMRDLG